MTTVEIVRVQGGKGNDTFRAVTGELVTEGKTAGKALDAMVAQLPDDAGATLVVLQDMRPDAFFGAEQQARLAELMERWRAARDADSDLPANEQAELDALVQEELRAAAKRTEAILHHAAR